MKRLGVIGGTGVYKLDGVEVKKEIKIDTPFGLPSSDFILSEYQGKEVVFLSRHQAGHRIGPSFINYRANIYGMKKLGVSKILSISACGSLREGVKPLDFVIPDQFIDRTSKRKDTFFEGEIVAHVALANPVCSKLTKSIKKAAESVKVKTHSDGVYLNMEGPQFSTKAESNLYRSWGADIIGMTNFSEAKLAREAEICYATLAAVTDFDCWHPNFGKVSVEVILNYLQKNSQNSKQIIKHLIDQVDPEAKCECQEALGDSIATNPNLIPQETKKKLDVIIGKYIK